MRYLKINDVIVEQAIEGFHSFAVDGREMPEAELTTTKIDGITGETFRTKRYNGRTLTVAYALIAESEYQLQRKFEALNEILNQDQVKIIFGDDPDVYFIGTRTGMTQPEGAPTVMAGRIDFYCADPCKYSVAEYEVNAVNGTFNVDYHGNYPARPKLVAKFSADCGFVGFADDREHVIQVGSANEDDYGDVYVASSTQFDANAEALNGWTKNSATVLNSVELVGSTSTGTVGSETALIPSFGTGSGLHGVAVSKTVTASKNCTLTYKQRLAQTKKNQKQYGQFQCLLLNAANNVVAGVVIDKTKSGKNATISAYVNGAAASSVSKSVMYEGTLFGFGKNAVLATQIIKSGANFSFNVGGWKFTTALPALESVTVTKVVFVFAVNGTQTVYGYNGLYSARFVKDECNDWGDIPNKFRNGDELVIDCATASITLNGLSYDSEGAIGNDWEGFTLISGANTIGAVQSAWANSPQYKLIYQERFI